jgi:hypothetical protein
MTGKTGWEGAVGGSPATRPPLFEDGARLAGLTRMGSGRRPPVFGAGRGAAGYFVVHGDDVCRPSEYFTWLPRWLLNTKSFRRRTLMSCAGV